LLESAAGFLGGHHARVCRELLRELQRGRDGHRQELGHGLAVQAQREGGRGEASALAAGADGARLELQQALAERLAGGGPVGMFELGEHARPDGLDGLAALGRREQELTFGVAVQQEFADGLGEVAPRGLEVEWHLLGERAGDRVTTDERLARGALPRLHDAVVDREGLVADGEAFLETHLTAEAAAVRAGAFGMVVREGAGADGLIRLAAVFAGEVE